MADSATGAERSQHVELQPGIGTHRRHGKRL